tara:strand:+ start:944 stop:1294 length:351 start_codon:yes stop_codon:yes gene_type:complete
MKITRKILQDLIKEETIKVLSEEPAESPADKEKAERKRLLAIIKDPNSTAKQIADAKKELEDLGPPGFDPDQGSIEENLSVDARLKLIEKEVAKVTELTLMNSKSLALILKANRSG